MILSYIFQNSGRPSEGLEKCPSRPLKKNTPRQSCSLYAKYIEMRSGKTGHIWIALLRSAGKWLDILLELCLPPVNNKHTGFSRIPHIFYIQCLSDFHQDVDFAVQDAGNREGESLFSPQQSSFSTVTFFCSSITFESRFQTAYMFS